MVGRESRPRQAGGAESRAPRPRARLPAEGYRLRSFDNGGAPGVEITGNDERGVLFGSRRPAARARNAPRFRHPARHAGHQNRSQIRAARPPVGLSAQDELLRRWDVPQWESYIRDLAVFGANAIELIPPRSDDAADSPHFPLPPMQMMIEMSRLAQEYGLECWIWYPAMDPDYADPATVTAALQEWGEVFRQLPRVDAVFVPGGDPGHTEPKHLYGAARKADGQSQALSSEGHDVGVARRASMPRWMDQFFGLMDQHPAWLTGIVFGPQVRVNLPELRQRIPKQYPIRFYPGHHALRQRASSR